MVDTGLWFYYVYIAFEVMGRVWAVEGWRKDGGVVGGDRRCMI